MDLSNLADEEIELLTWEPPLKRAFLVSIQKSGMGENEWITDYRPAETAEDARALALREEGVIKVRVQDMGLAWADMERELPGGDKFSWQGD